MQPVYMIRCIGWLEVRSPTWVGVWVLGQTVEWYVRGVPLFLPVHSWKYQTSVETRPPHGLMPCLESQCFLSTQIRAHFLKSHTGSDPNAPIKTDAQWACMADDEDRQYHVVEKIVWSAICASTLILLTLSLAHTLHSLGMTVLLTVPERTATRLCALAKQDDVPVELREQIRTSLRSKALDQDAPADMGVAWQHVVIPHHILVAVARWARPRHETDLCLDELVRGARVYVEPRPIYRRVRSSN